MVNYLTCDSLLSFYGLRVRDFKPLSVSLWFVVDLFSSVQLYDLHQFTADRKKLCIAAEGTYFS